MTSPSEQSERVERFVMCFEMTHKSFGGGSKRFSQTNAPDWLTSVNTVPGSTRVRDDNQGVRRT